MGRRWNKSLEACYIGITCRGLAAWCTVRFHLKHSHTDEPAISQHDRWGKFLWNSFLGFGNNTHHTAIMLCPIFLVTWKTTSFEWSLNKKKLWIRSSCGTACVITWVLWLRRPNKTGSAFGREKCYIKVSASQNRRITVKITQLLF